MELEDIFNIFELGISYEPCKINSYIPLEDKSLNPRNTFSMILFLGFGVPKKISSN